MCKLAAALLAALVWGSAAYAPASAQPAAHQPSKHARAHKSPAPKYVTISGSVLAINGDLVQFREDDGTTVSVDQHNLLSAGQPLTLGGHFALHGYFSNDIFIAQPNAGPAAANGYPYPRTTQSVQGIVAAVDGHRVTIMQGLFATISIDDQQALNRGMVKNLTVGRSITAYGYWSGPTFFATSIA